MTAAEVFEFRRRMRITQDRLRELLGYKDVMTISRWERGVKDVPEHAAEKMKEMLRQNRKKQLEHATDDFMRDFNNEEAKRRA